MELFVADAFSDSTPKFSAAPAATESHIRGIAAEAYSSLGEPGRIEKSGSLEINSSNFKVAFSRGDYIFKRLPGGPGKTEQFLEQAAVSESLREGGMPMPAFVETDRGGWLFPLEDAVWCVQKFVEGSYFSGAQRELESTARTLRALADGRVASLACAHVPGLPIVDLGGDNDAWRVLERPEDYGHSLGANAVSLLREHAARVFGLRDRLTAGHPGLARDIGLCHIDLHPHNLLVRGGSVAAVLDFESWRPAARSSLMAYGCYKLLRQARVAGGHDTMERLRAHLELPDLLGTSQPSRHAQLAAAEILRRLCLILHLNARGENTWNHMIEVMLRAIHEVPLAFGAEG